MLLVLGVAASAVPAVAAAPLTVNARVFAHHPAGGSKPDDITILDDLIYVTYQNNADKDGTPAGSYSTVIAYDRNGNQVATYKIPGRCDGLTADPANNRILASANEDLNSSLYVIHPGTPAPTHYTYSPDPAQTGSDGTNGGTDAISITPTGTIYVAHSNPDPKLPAPNNTAAVYTMTLTGTTAQLKPVFGVNDKATSINKPGSPATPLGLTDPDSNLYLPNVGGGTLVQDSQGDSKLVFATNLGSGAPTLKQLTLTNATASTATGANASTTPQIDDMAEVTGPGTLYVVDQGASARIYAIDTSNIPAGTLFVSQPKPSTGDLPNDPSLATLDQATGVVTHVQGPMTSPKGLLFVPAAQKTDLASTAAISKGTTSHKRLVIAIGVAAIIIVMLAVAAIARVRRSRS